MVFQLLGGSNFIRIEYPTHTLHEGFIRNTYSNLSVSGLSVHPRRGRFILDYIDADTIDKVIILFVNSNGYALTDYSTFVTDYISAIRQILAKGYSASQIILLTPLIRGDNIRHHFDQLMQINRLKLALDQLHITHYDTYHHLPVSLRDTSKLFGRRSIRQRSFIHYSSGCRNSIHDLVGFSMMCAYQLDF